LQEIAGKLAFPAPELEELKKISRPFGLQTGQQLKAFNEVKRLGSPPQS
jgi:hypothetical protein